MIYSPTPPFQSTHPRGVRPTKFIFQLSLFSFQSTHPRGVRPFGALDSSLTGHFNPRTREGCDAAHFIRRGTCRDFNPRTREGCDFSFARLIVTPFTFQSTHPRGVRLQNKASQRRYRPISIHAPVRGATIVGDGQFYSFVISIHAPARGATLSRWIKDGKIQDFNPRTREGCDLSITSTKSVFSADFNPRTREGCDRCRLNRRRLHRGFQSTHPRGVRPVKDLLPIVVKISIHAPARGATSIGATCT